MNGRLQWKLDDIVSLKDYDKLLAQIEADTAQYPRWYKKLEPDMSAEQFRKYLQFSVESGEKLARAATRPELMETLDQADTKAKDMKGRIKDIALAREEAGRKNGLWLKGIELEGKQRLDDQNAKRLFAVWPEFEYGLYYARDAARYTLTEREEDIISNKDANGGSVLNDLRDLLISEMEFTIKLPGQKPQTFDSDDEVSPLAYSSDPKVREAAFRGLLDEYEKHSTKYFMVYQSIVKDWDYEAKLRGYESPIALRNFANQVPDRAIEVLMKVCADNTKVFQQYFRFKAKQLGMKKLRRFDIYAPLENSTTEYPLDKAIDVVITTFNSFSPRFADYAKRIIEAGHVDSEPGKRKRGGAFAAPITADLTPYVLLNYTKTLRDVSTLAHELGHGVHFLYASELPTPVQMSGLPLAETASTFGEMILFEKLLDEARDNKERKIMLSDKMADAYATICRQTFFVRAEIEAHKRMGQGLSAAEMGEIWLDTLHDQFGDSVEVDPIFASEWLRIPHIVHSPFYCYAYNFGELLSLALFARYKEQGQVFVPKIEKILEAGGSQNPQKILAQVGIDMTDAQFWQGSFTILEDWMKQLESL